METFFKKNGTAVRAHPGYPDLVGFGRRKMAVSPAERKAMVMYQIGALSAFCQAEGIPLQHGKPHGAMYKKDLPQALAICEGIRAVNPKLILPGPSGQKLIEAAKQVGLPCRSEVFADRAYEEDGALAARTKEGAMITDEDLAVQRVIQMVKEGTVTAITGKVIPVQADSICLHGDSKKAVLFAEKISSALKDAGIRIRPMGEQR